MTPPLLLQNALPLHPSTLTQRLIVPVSQVIITSMEILSGLVCQLVTQRSGPGHNFSVSCLLLRLQPLPWLALLTPVRTVPAWTSLVEATTASVILDMWGLIAI